jgi:lysophospholipase L1-like esterase
VSIIFDHDWTGVADVAAGGAGSTAGADQDGGWTDRAGGQASVGGGVLLLAGTGDYGGLVYRPDSEAVAHGRVTARPRSLGPAGMFWICPRVVDAAAGDFYAFRFSLNGNVVVADYAFPFVAGSPGAPVALALREPAGTQVGDDLTFAIEAPASAGGSTEYVLTITNLTRGGSTTATAADATAALQAAGAVALLSEGGSGTVGLRSVTAEDLDAAPAATTYALTAPTTPHGPVGSASGDFTITPDGPYSGTITPQASPAGGTFAPTSLTWSGDAVGKTFTFTPASAGAKSISATNSGGLTDPAAVTYTADAAAPPDPGGPPAEKPAVVVAVFGDSTGNMPTGHSNEVAAGGGRDGDNWPYHLVRFLSFARGPRSATTWNYSQDGTTATEWAMDTVGATRAADAATRDCTAVIVSLGHNDATAGTAAATYGAKVADLIAAIHDAGIPTVYLLDPISDQVSGAAGDLIAAYEAALDGLADGTGARRLRTRSADRWAPRTDLHPTDVHPTTAGAIALAELVGTFLLDDLEPPAGGGGGGGGGGTTTLGDLAAAAMAGDWATAGDLVRDLIAELRGE